MINKEEEAAGVHSSDFGFKEKIDSVNGAGQRSEMTNPAIKSWNDRKSNCNYYQA